MSVIAIFAFGFIASNEENENMQTEQKQESTKEREIRKKKEKEAEFTRMLEKAYYLGKQDGITFTFYDDNICSQYFTKMYFTPSTDEEFEIFKKFKNEYNRGFIEGHNVKIKMQNM